MKHKTLENHRHPKELLKHLIWKVMTVLVFMMLPAFLSRAEASTVVGRVNVVVNYLEETATVTPGSNASTKFYVSKDKKTWEVMSSNVLDISTFLKPKETMIYFKGNRDSTINEVKLTGEDVSLKAAYNVFGGAGKVDLSGSSLPIEFRKGANGQWKTLTTPFLTTTPYETYGATLYFRITGTETRRPGKVVSVKIPKRPSAPSVKLDGSKLYISGLKQGETQYRVNDAVDWTLFPVSSTLKTLDLKTLLASELPVNTPFPGGTIEFRTISNDSKKKVASSVKVIEVPPQPTTPGNITLNGTTLTAVDSNKKKYYEYTVVKSTATLDMKTAKWTSFTSSKPVIVKDATIGDKIYVRAKSYTDSATKLIVLPSTYGEHIVKTITPGK